jgi:hypothetical protein
MHLSLHTTALLTLDLELVGQITIHMLELGQMELLFIATKPQASVLLPTM